MMVIEKTKNSEELPHSYHTFLFPFIWGSSKGEGVEAFKKELLEKEDGQSKCRWVEEDDSKQTKETIRKNYDKYQYFTPAMRKLVFGDNNNESTICNLIYKLGNNEKNYYTITSSQKIGDKNNDNDTDKDKPASDKPNFRFETFLLPINSIRLRIYNTGVAILNFELEYRGNKYSEEKTLDKYKILKERVNYNTKIEDCPSVAFNLDDINKINEYGRRICLPYIGKKESPCVLTADKLSIQFEEENKTKKILEENFLKTIKNFHDKEDKILDLDYIMKPIADILEVSTSKNGEAKSFIYPAIDDRMFVHCMVLDDNLSKQIKGKDVNGNSEEVNGNSEDVNGNSEDVNGNSEEVNDNSEGTNGESNAGFNEDLYLKGWDVRKGNGWADEKELANKLYKLFFVETGVTCQNTHMKKEILERSIYERWSDSGSIYGITHHSLVGVTEKNRDIFDSVIAPFQNVYIELVNTVLAQRATIISLSDEAQKVSVQIGKNKNPNLALIENLQKKYAQAQSQVMLFEVTTQEQGVEMYKMLRRELYIEENKNDLDMQMQNLRDVADIMHNRIQEKNSNILNILLAILTVLGLLFTMVQTPLILTNKCSKILYSCIENIGAATTLYVPDIIFFIILISLPFMVYFILKNIIGLCSKVKRSSKKRK